MTVIAAEIDRCSRLSATWWNNTGWMRALHGVNIFRLTCITDRSEQHFGRARGAQLAGMRTRDLGFGGGLMSKPMAQRGARVGIDVARGNAAAARLQAASEGVSIDHRLGQPSAALHDDGRFAVVLALNVVEHVSDVNTLTAVAARYVAPSGLLFASTVDRPSKRSLLAIVGAEYLLPMQPRGTQAWQRFVRPAELAAAVSRASLVQTDLRGMRYRPLVHCASWPRDTRVNCIAESARQARSGRREQP